MIGDFRFHRLPCSTPRLICEVNRGKRILALRRSTVAFRSVGELDESFAPIHQWLSSVRRADWRLLVDARAAPPRMTPSFDPAFERHRIAVTSGFRRIAVLVLGTVARFEVERRSRSADSEHVTFIDEAEALQYLMADDPLHG